VSAPAISIQPVTTRAQRDWVRQVTISEWGAEIVIAHGTVFHPADLPAFFAGPTRQPVGLITYHLCQEMCEIVTINAWLENRGIGSALIQAVEQVTRQAGCRRLFLVTTNNNLHALRFFQKRGFHICALRVGAIEESRRLKPQIPLVDDEGLPIRDEIELELIY
jgi:GNAT superfamily N-acetyltransferase